MAANKKTNDVFSRHYPLVLVKASLIGLVATFWQTAERVHMLKYPEKDLSCNLSPVVDCSGVLNDGLAAVFGPPNAMIGMVVFALLLAFGIQRLSGGEWTEWSRKIVVGLSMMILLFALWFFWVSLYVLGKICIFCVFIWLASVPIGVYGLQDYVSNNKKYGGWLGRVQTFLRSYSSTTVLVIYAAMVTLFFMRFQDYYF